MSDIFSKAVDDIFNVPEFIEYFFSEGVKVKCVRYEMSADSIYTQFGFDSGISFFLTCKSKDFTPCKGKKIIYKNKEYKIDTFTADSFDLTYKIFLKSVTSK